MSIWDGMPSEYWPPQGSPMGAVESGWLEQEKSIQKKRNEPSRQEVINERRQKIVDRIKKSGTVQTKEIANMLGISRRTALRYLSELMRDGIIEQIRTGRNVSYKFLEGSR